ncbi:MAG: type II secretion system protein [Synergistaceae bacterium]|nr:type II secretion system protein [Synergistaceae bacterium]
MTNRAFTLIEVLVAVMLTGLLTTMALVPVVRAVREVAEVQASWGGRTALSRALDFIGRDLAGAVRLSPNVLTVRDHEALGGLADDVLLVMTSAPAMRRKSACTAAYKIVEGGMMNTSLVPGLYRWELPGRVPNTVNTDRLDPDDGALVLPFVREFSAEIPSGSSSRIGGDTDKNYSGPMPNGLIVKIVRGERTNSYNEGVYDELERIFVIP